MSLQKPAPVDHPVHSLLRDRYSPRAFDGEALQPGELLSLLEAARWAPSCFNEQPWRFIAAERSDTESFERLLACLDESNQIWARQAGALLISVASKTFARNAKPNPFAWHDVGMATFSLTIEAAARGLGVHQMAGFDAERVQTVCEVPEGYQPLVAIAVGRPGSVEDLPSALAEREGAPRERQPLEKLAFAGKFGVSLK